MKKTHTHGFTLIEIMIVVAIVAILASIAYPSYQDSVRKGRRAQARTAILELLQQQERYMTQRNCYLPFSTASNGTSTAVADTACGFTTGTAVPFKNFSGDALASGHYLLSSAACPGASAGTTQPLRDCVQITAALKVAGIDPQVDSLTATSVGARGCTGTVASSNPKLCWP